MMPEERFIETPIETIMEEAVGAFSLLGGGVETYPISEYMFQSLFLKLTGAQEQKLRCICWYVSSHDYDFRFDYLKKYKDLGEFSTYSNKDDVYGLLNNYIGSYDFQKVKIHTDQKAAIIQECAKAIARIFGDSPLKEWNLREYRDFKSRITAVSTNEMALPDKLLTGDLKSLYNNLHTNRNRYAHNTISYQQNLPSMRSLVKEGGKSNYYDWFFLLLLLDKVFMNRFAIVKEIIEQAE